MKFKNTITCSIPPNMKILFRGMITKDSFFIVIENETQTALKIFIGESIKSMKEISVTNYEKNINHTLKITTNQGIFCLPTRHCRTLNVEQATFQGKEIVIHE